MPRHQHVREAMDAFVKQVSNDAPLMQDILTRIVIDCMSRYQEKIRVGAEDSVADLLVTFKQKIADEIFGAAQAWTQSNTSEVFLFPKNCRFLHTVGSSIFAVIEHGPKNQSLRLDYALLSENYEEASFDSYTRHCLAIPYSIFVFHFAVKQGMGRLCNLYYAWRKAPLSSLSDKIYVPYLPNLHKNLAVCVGASNTILPKPIASGGWIDAIVDESLANFWGSPFNADLSTHWWQKKSHESLRTAKDWEENTRQNSLFILDIPFQEKDTLGQFLAGLVQAAKEDEPNITDLNHRLTEAVDEISKQLFNKITSFLKKSKFDRYYPKDITSALSKAMEPVAEEVSLLASALNAELNKISSDKPCSKPEYWYNRV